MRQFDNLSNPDIPALINSGAIGVIPTDTLYGLVARASDQAAVERMYAIRDRSPDKPFIILVAGLEHIPDQALWTKLHYKLAKKYWPGPMSLVAPTKIEQFYLHRGTETLAYRVPANPQLWALLQQTGPLIAPSVNPAGQPPAASIAQAKKYFGSRVDFYVDGSEISNVEPSTLVTIVDGQVKTLRPGQLKIEA